MFKKYFSFSYHKYPAEAIIHVVYNAKWCAASCLRAGERKAWLSKFIVVTDLLAGDLLKVSI